MALQDYLATYGNNGGYNYRSGSAIEMAPANGVWSAAAPGGDINQAGANQDPFGYTNGSFLTPWTRTFQAPTAAPSSGGSGGGSPAPAAPGFDYGFGGYSARDVGDFNLGELFKAPEAFRGSRMAAPTPFSGGRVADVGPFTAPVGVFNPGTVNLRDFIANTPAFRQDRFTAPEAFVPPNVIDDPGYQIRLKRGEDALLNNAASRGVLRGNANTMRALIDYNQDSASQEYGAAYQRAKERYDTAANLSLAAYDRNAAANAAENQTAYNREVGAYDRNIANALASYDRNAEAGFRANDTAYNRGASEFDRRIALNEADYARSAGEDDRNFARTMAVNEANYGREAGEYDRNLTNALNVYQANLGNRLAAYGANAQNAQAMGNLGWNIASGTYDRNFQNYATGFNIDEQRRQQAAAMAAAGAGNARADEQQAYNRALTQYGMEYEQFRQNQADQFSRLMALASLGQNAATNTGYFGGQYGNAAGGYLTGIGNALAAGQIGSGNAWAAGLQGAGNAALNAAGMYLESQRPKGR